MLPADRFRQIANRGEIISNALGQRPYTVTILTQTFAAAIANGVAKTGETALVLTPSPKVVQIGPADASWYAGGIVAESTARMTGLAYDIGPIVQAFPGAGYQAAQLVPAPGSTAQRPAVRIAGPDLKSGGEIYSVMRVWVSDGGPLYLMFTVMRAAQL